MIGLWEYDLLAGVQAWQSSSWLWWITAERGILPLSSEDFPVVFLGLLTIGIFLADERSSQIGGFLFVFLFFPQAKEEDEENLRILYSELSKIYIAIRNNLFVNLKCRQVWQQTLDSLRLCRHFIPGNETVRNTCWEQTNLTKSTAAPDQVSALSASTLSSRSRASSSTKALIPTEECCCPKWITRPAQPSLR